MKNIIGWIKKIIKPVDIKADAFPEEDVVSALNVKDKTKNIFYLYDATNRSLIKTSNIVGKSILPIRSVGEMGGGHQLGTTQQQAMAIKQIVDMSLRYLNSRSFKKLTRWIGTKTLVLNARAGKDINAYYDRNSLKFFYFGDPIRRKNVYACDSMSVVSHELGHAFLDGIRPDWWNIASIEIWSIHESFGDITALLTAMQHDELITSALNETKNNLRQSNILSRLAGDMGIGLFNITKGVNGEPKNCLRDMTIPWNYVIPENLPEDGRDDVLLNECHSFSRILTNACYEIIIRIYEENIKIPKITRTEALKLARDTFASTYLKAIAACPTNARAFNALAKQMIQEDKLLNGNKYTSIYSSVFGNRNILQRGILMLSDQNFEKIKENMKEYYEIQDFGKEKIIRTVEKKVLKISDYFEISALNTNPLLNLEVEVPNETVYYFDEDEKLVDIQSASEAEMIDAAYSCLKYLHSKNKVGNHKEAIFEIKGNKLIRKQFSCKCNKPNYCDPNAPEYGKPWKPANNSGCVSCVNKNCLPLSCECDQTPPPQPVKKGCYTKFKTCNGSSYKIGSTISRKVC